jgi:Glycosyl hydrolase family 12
VRPRITVAVALACVLVAGAPAAQARGAGGSGSGDPQVICGLNHRALQNASGGIQVISRPNPFGTTQRFCVKASAGRPGFLILTSLRSSGLVQAFPFTGVGCAYSLCSPRTDLPRRVRSLPRRLDSSWTWWGTTGGFWNVAYDIWFDSRDQITTADNGAELMIWLRTPPGYTIGRLVWVDRSWFWFTHWRTGHRVCRANGHCQVQSWNYVQFRFLHTTHAVRDLRLRPFIQFAIRQGLISPSWWLTSVHAGYELWGGGRGLATTWFNAHT